jgi:recombination protein RecA
MVKLKKKTGGKKTLKRKTTKKKVGKKVATATAVAKKTTTKKDKNEKPEKPKSLLETIEAKVRKDHGDDSILRLTKGVVKPVPVAFRTGLNKLDKATGIGGYPLNRVIEIFGPESSGKTTLTLHAIAECQKAGGIATFIDAEHALDIIYAQNLGVNVEKLLISQPDNGEHALDILETCVKTNREMQPKHPSIIVVDSVAALIPKAELEGEMGDPAVGLQARMMSQSMRRLTSMMKNSNCVVIFINQTRARISFGYGPSTTTTGGNALKFYASVRIDVRRIGQDKDGKKTENAKVTGAKTKVKIVKNKVAPPFVEFESVIRFGEGFDELRDVYETLCALKSVTKPKKSAYVTLPNEKKFCGYKGFRDNYVDPEFVKYVDELIEKGE